jgi:O-acetyl-ADP-ribose deacetylase (regulator of RNase III)
LSFHFVKTRVQIMAASSPWPEGDALVLPANDYLWMSTGPARAVKQAAGEDVERLAVRAGPIAVGDVVATPAGSLPLQGILHWAVMGQDLALQPEEAAAGLRKAIHAAEQRRWLRLLVHSFTTAGRATRPEAASATILHALVEELLEGAAITSVMLLAADEKDRKLLHESLLRIVQAHP